eukprot:15484945-Alexandrium_andersonii.AAC.1
MRQRPDNMKTVREHDQRNAQRHAYKKGAQATTAARGAAGLCGRCRWGAPQIMLGTVNGRRLPLQAALGWHGGKPRASHA